jgi:hypothetical protein
VSTGSSFWKILRSVAVTACMTGCASLQMNPIADSVELPFFKNTPNECYYLDEFMPVPDGLVSGRHGAMTVRYYSYHRARYKDFLDRRIVLSFYSNDDHCWSLFEEYYSN